MSRTMLNYNIAIDSLELAIAHLQQGLKLEEELHQACTHNGQPVISIAATNRFTEHGIETAVAAQQEIRVASQIVDKAVKMFLDSITMEYDPQVKAITSTKEDSNQHKEHISDNLIPQNKPKN